MTAWGSGVCLIIKKELEYSEKDVRHNLTVFKLTTAGISTTSFYHSPVIDHKLRMWNADSRRSKLVFARTLGYFEADG